MKKSLVHLIRRVQLGPVLGREGHVGEYIGLRFVEEAGELGELGAELVGDLSPLGVCGLGIVLGKGGGDEGGDDTPPALAGMRERVAHEVHAAALPGGVEHLGDSGLDALMGIRHDQLDAAQAAARELAQERTPERLGFRRTNIHAEHFAPAITVDADRDNHRDRDDAALLAHLHVGGVDPQIRPVALDRTGEEGLHLVIDLGTQPAHLALGDPAHAHGLHEIVDRAGRDALHVGFLHHGGERLLGHAAGLQEAGEVGALAQLGDAQFDRVGASLPNPVAVAVALRQTLGALLAIGGPGLAFHFHLHQTLGGKADHLAQQIRIGGLLHERSQVHHLVGHRWFLESGWCQQSDPTGESPVTTAKPSARYGAI